MKRKEAPRPSDSSDNSAGSGGGLTAGPTSSSGSGPLSSSISGPASSSVGCPSSSPSNPSSDVLTGPKSTSNVRSETVSGVGQVDPRQSVAAHVVGSDASTCPPDSRGTNLPLRAARSTGQMAKPAKPPVFSSSQSADTGSSVAPVVPHTPATSSPGVSQSADTGCSVSAVILNTPATSSTGVSQSADTGSSVSPVVLHTPATSSPGVSQSADTVTSAAAAAVLRRPTTLQCVDNSTDIQLETLASNEAVSADLTDSSCGNVTQL